MSIESCLRSPLGQSPRAVDIGLWSWALWCIPVVIEDCLSLEGRGSQLGHQGNTSSHKEECALMYFFGLHSLAYYIYLGVCV